MEIPREPKFYPNKNEVYINVQVQVDTKQLDEAIEKMNQLEKKLEHLEKETKHEKSKSDADSSVESAFILAANQLLVELKERL